MKKILVTLLVISTILAIIGCKDKNISGQVDNNQKTEEQASSNNVDSNNEVNILQNNDKIIGIHEELLQKVKKVFTDNNIPAKTKEDDTNKLYDGESYISYSDSDEKAIGKVFNALYKLGFDDDGNATGITISMRLGVDEEAIKNQGFKFEDTPLNDLATIVINDSKHIDEVNNMVNKAYKEDGKEKETFVYDNITASVKIQIDQIIYIIKIKPESVKLI